MFTEKTLGSPLLQGSLTGSPLHNSRPSEHISNTAINFPLFESYISFTRTEDGCFTLSITAPIYVVVVPVSCSLAFNIGAFD